MPVLQSVKKLVVNPELRRRAVALTRTNRPGKLSLPSYIGKPGMVIISDSHGEVETYLKIYEALPSKVRFGIDLGDKVDRGPQPLEMNYLLQTLRVKRTLGNHDAMWLAAGLGIRSQAIELVRWLMRYNEIDFLTSGLGVDLSPLRGYADRHFQPEVYRTAVKSKISQDMEAAATYLKIIAEAGVRFPEHKETVLNDSERRIRKALFFTDAVEKLTSSEKEMFDRLTSGEKLSEADENYFYRLMGGLREFNEEEQQIIDHLANEFLSNYSFYNFVRWMIGEGDLYLTFRTRQGYPCDIIATHAQVPLTEKGELSEFAGRYGREAMIRLKHRIQIGMEAWRQLLEHGDPNMMEVHTETVDTLSILPWDVKSPLYGRQMQTAARAVLPKSSGTREEQEEPFYTHLEKNHDPEMLVRARHNIAGSFGIPNPDNFVIIRGHKPNKEKGNLGMYQLFAGGTVINIDAGMASNYGGYGGAIIFGSRGATWLSARDMTFHQVPLPEQRSTGDPLGVRVQT